MASPVVAATAVTSNLTGTPNTINLPNGIATGDLLIVSLRKVVNTVGHTYPGSWTKFAEDLTHDGHSIAYREVDGTEGFTGTGDTISVSGPNSRGCAVAWRITGAEAVATQAPQTSTVALGTSTDADPTTVTPTGGSKDYLFLWVGGCEGKLTSPPSGNPTNYSNPIGAVTDDGGSAAVNCRAFGAQRALTASSEDPPLWALSAAEDWLAWTVAIHPASAGGPQTVDGVALTVTPSLPAGALKHTVTGAALSATPSLPAGALTHTLAGTALTATPSLPAGSTAVVDLKAWWDFADASTLYEDASRTDLVDVDGDLIMGVADKSGGGEHAVQSTSTKAPLYKTGIINGLSVARFDGTDDWITNLNTFASDASWTLFMVAQKRSAPSAATDTLFSSHAANAVLYTDTDVSTGHNWSMNQASGQVQLGGTPANVNIIAFRINSASSMDVYHNGNSNWDNFDPNDSITTAASLVFGANVTGADAGDYDIGEIIIYSSALSDENLDILGNYLGTKWGVTWTNISGGQTVTGAVLTVTPSLPAGSLTHRLTGAALSATPSLPAGTLRHSLTGVALSATPTMPTGLVAQTNVLGTALSAAPSLPAGSLQHALSGVVLNASPTLPAGQVATTSLLGAVLTVTPTLPAGTVSAAAEDTVSGIVLTVTPTLPVGALTHRLTGVSLSATPYLPAGEEPWTGSAVYDGTGSVTWGTDRITVDSAGSGDFWGTTDGGAIVYRPLVGGVDEVHLLSFPTTGHPRLFQLRKSAAANAAMYAVLLDSDGSHITTVWRDTDGASAGFAGENTGIPRIAGTPLWLRITYSGSTATAYASQDGGATWEQVGTRSVSGLTLAGVTNGGGTIGAVTTVFARGAGLIHQLAGVTLSATPLLPAGALTHQLAGVALTATPSLPVGILTTAQIVQGAVLTLSPTLPVGSVSIPLSVLGQVLEALASLPIGSVTGPRVNQPSKPHTAVIKRGIPRSGQPL